MWPDLGQPAPRADAVPYSPLTWPSGSCVSLDSGDLGCGELSTTTLKTRRTLREFGPISLKALGPWFELSCRVLALQTSELGFDLTRRPAPSAGAIHPIHVVLAGPSDSSWYRYDPFLHALLSFECAVDSRETHESMQTIVPASNATLVLLVAEPGRTQAKYANSTSLVWRDSGALLATMGIAAHALSLAFCPLGATGEPWASRLLEKQGLAGVGAAFVGRTRSSA